MFVKTENSSCIYSVEYTLEGLDRSNGLIGLLIIRFRESMRKYAYVNVPSYLVEAMLQAPSVGRAYNNLIKRNKNIVCATIKGA